MKNTKFEKICTTFESYPINELSVTLFVNCQKQHESTNIYCIKNKFMDYPQRTNISSQSTIWKYLKTTFQNTNEFTIWKYLSITRRW